MNTSPDRSPPPESDPSAAPLPDESSAPLDHDGDAIIGKAFLLSLGVLALILAGIGVAAWGWRTESPRTTAVPAPLQLPRERTTSAQAVPFVPFTDITRQAGITFVHQNGATGEKLLPETMGGGCAFLDFDQDGDQDLLLVNSCHWPWDAPPDEPATMALYANDGSGQFHDVTQSTGLDQSLYAMGVAVGDYDNDGDVDLYLSAVGKNRLLRNDQGHFVDVTQAAGVAGAADQWSSSCGWLDYDNDGDLDLFVCNYVRWSREIDKQQNFQLTGIGRAYGPPTAFEGAHPYLFRNNGDGTFRDVSQESGVQQLNEATGMPLAKSLGLAPIDLDQDGWIDLVVANDTVRNFVLHNQQDGTFREIGTEAGVAFDADGRARGAMGIDAAHFRNDASLGIAIANFANEMTALYVGSAPTLLFTDDAIPSGLGPLTRLDLAFGLCFFDYDLDGRLDLLSANGHLENEINTVQASQHYRQPARLFWNAGDQGSSEFIAVSPDQSGTDLTQPIVGRGAAYADIDQDGDLDVLLTQIAGPPLLLRNDQQLDRHYLRLKLIGTHCNRDAIGAWIEVQQGENKLRRQVMPTRSYLSQVELPVTIGLGENPQIDRVEILWPDGTRQQLKNVATNQQLEVQQPAAR